MKEFERVFYSPYQLIPKSALAKSTLGSVAHATPRRGVLLRFHWPDRWNEKWNGECVGYADCFPWPELGDLRLDQQLELLKARQFTDLSLRSLGFAYRDALARQQGVSLFSGPGSSLNIPLRLIENHALIPDLNELKTDDLRSLASKGFRKVKIKVRRDSAPNRLCAFASEFEKLQFKIRLDFNGSLSFEEVNRTLESLGQVRELIDFIEDPCPYDYSNWSQIQEKWKVRLALDRLPKESRDLELGAPDWVAGLNSAFSVLIIKPAIQDGMKMIEWAQSSQLRGVSVVVTSYLDHPFGQTCAAWTAARLFTVLAGWRNEVRLETCGLLSHTSYEANPFSAEWINSSMKSDGPQFQIPKGTGFGFDELLKVQEWKLL